MALQNFANHFGTRVMPFAGHGHPNTVSRTMDAAGESVFGIGQILLSTGPGTSKVFSSSGAKLYWSFVSGTFANGSTNLRLGVQDLTSGLEDATFDVYADLVGGTDTLTAGVMATAFETGSKTIAHGDFVAIGMEMTTRGGADSVLIRTLTAVELSSTYLSIDSGSGPGRVVGMPLFTLASDDGTIGWLIGTPPVFVEVATTFGNGSTPDEYATIFKVPFSTKIMGITAVLDNVATTDTMEFVLYSDPTGTPAVVSGGTITIDPTLIAGPSADAFVTGMFAAPITLAINTNYAIAVKPTSANTITLSRLQFGSGNAALRAVTPLGTNWSEGTRSDVTGAFSSNTENLPLIGPILSAFDDGAGSGPMVSIQSPSIVFGRGNVGY